MSETAKAADGGKERQATEDWIAEGPPDNIHIVERARPHMRVCFMTSNGPTKARARLIAAAPMMADYVRRRAETGDQEAQEIIGAIDASR